MAEQRVAIELMWHMSRNENGIPDYYQEREPDSLSWQRPLMYEDSSAILSRGQAQHQRLCPPTELAPVLSPELFKKGSELYFVWDSPELQKQHADVRVENLGSAAAPGGPLDQSVASHPSGTWGEGLRRSADHEDRDAVQP